MFKLAAELTHPGVARQVFRGRGHSPDISMKSTSHSENEAW